MSAIFPTSLLSYLNILGIFLRLLGFFMLVPGFSHRTIPPMVKLLLALVVALALYPLLAARLESLPLESLSGLVTLVLRETILGFLMGFVAYLTFEAIHLAAQFIGFQMGFGAAGLVDPVNHSQVSVLVPLTGWVALMVFFLTDMHHNLLVLFVRSFEITHSIELQSFSTLAVAKLLIQKTGELFIVAVKIAAPYTFLVLATNAAVGILSRLLPQMQMLLFVFPVTIFLGICGLYLLAPDLIDYFQGVMDQMGQDVILLLRTI